MDAVLNFGVIEFLHQNKPYPILFSSLMYGPELFVTL